MASSDPPRRIRAERRHASLKADVLCDAPREEPFLLNAQYALLVWFISAISRT